MNACWFHPALPNYRSEIQFRLIYNSVQGTGDGESLTLKTWLGGVDTTVGCLSLCFCSSGASVAAS